MRNAKGFTLVELMIVVAIIGILAGLAIPSFLDMQMRARRAELPANLSSIRTAQLSYHIEFYVYIDCVLQPVGQGSKKRPFGNTDGTGWATIGWQPDGLVYGSYQVTDVNAKAFTAYALSDLDEDYMPAVYACTESSQPARWEGVDNDVF